jgi:DNA-binding transcriptional ArsR family regulator
MEQQVLARLKKLKDRSEATATELRRAVGAAVIDGAVRQTDIMRELRLAQETVRRWTAEERTRRAAVVDGGGTGR